nr:PREDICTED: FERM, RhoGEF and pleckstrin domain-containing protein 2 isoform X1 [Bemisia tabaci]
MELDTSISVASSCSKLPHSQSTPAGVDGGTRTPPTPPMTPKKGGKILAVRVQMLNDNITIFQVQAKALGRVLFDQVCKQLNLLEADYFGLEYLEGSTRYWLDLEKPMHRQVGLTLVDPLVFFCVKFYTPDPSQLEEEYTRYLFCLQIKRDLAQGHLQCNDNTAALMASYIVQADCGDYVAEDYPDHTYLSTYKFVPHQDQELERRIMENHKKHVGQSPAEADLNLLETARRCELYGMKMHPAKDHEGVPLNLAVAHMGIVVFQNYTKINTFSWAKIRKISFKRKRFLVKLHPEGYGFYKDVVEFFFENRNDCKNLWKKCVENHGFFRCTTVKPIPRQRTRVLSRGSSFRYSGKTQKQVIEYVRENYVKRQTFKRSQSFRQSSSVHSSVANVGGSISAHPLLPLGDSAVAGTGASLSCGSMSLSGAGEKHLVNAAEDSLSPISHRRQLGGAATSTPTIGNHVQTPGRTMKGHTSVDIHPPYTPHTHVSVVEKDLSTSSEVTSITSSSPQHSYTIMAQEYQDKKEICVVNPTILTKSIGATTNGTIKENNNVIINVVNGSHKQNGTAISNQSSLTDLSRAADSPVKSVKKDVSKVCTVEVEVIDGKKKRLSDQAYFITKELLSTERTFRKDLKVITFWFKDELIKEQGSLQLGFIDQLMSVLERIQSQQTTFIKDLEMKTQLWDDCTQYSLADILIKHFDNLQVFDEYIDQHLSFLENLDDAFHSIPKFEQIYKDFETQKVCYLPLTAFVLKPLQRLIHYYQLIEKLLWYYKSIRHPDFEDCLLLRQTLCQITEKLPYVLRQSENFVELCELERDMIGVERLRQSDRIFIRHGSLLKYSLRKSFQPRMFFLFSDVLLYTARVGHMFKLHGQLPLKNLIIEERDDTPSQYSFLIYGANRALTVAANSQEEKDKWLEDLSEAIQASKNRENENDNDKKCYLSLKSCGSSDEVLDKCGSEVEVNAKSTPTSQRSNTTVHVCWHRSTSVCIDDLLRAAENQLSGYLLRKFKNNDGWQKLWVVFTNFCLFFYKTYQDDCPLASLPLLGYSITEPSEKDGIRKDYVFKLQFKNHEYFFRAESEYTFGRWMEVIGSAAQHSERTQLYPCKDSIVDGLRLPS